MTKTAFNFGTEPVPCHHCGAAIAGDQSRHNYHKRPFCSDRCLSAHRRRQVMNPNVRPTNDYVGPGIRFCETCDAQFQSTRKSARYCSTKCRVAAHRKGKDQ